MAILFRQIEVKDDQMAPIFEDVFKRFFFCHIFAVKIAGNCCIHLYMVLSLRFSNKKEQVGKNGGKPVSTKQLVDAFAKALSPCCTNPWQESS